MCVYVLYIYIQHNLWGGGGGGGGGSLHPVNIFGFCKRLKGNVWQRLKNNVYKNHL